MRILDYDDLVEQIKVKADTQIPALMIICVRECVKRKIFKPGGLLRTVEKVIEDEERK
jgi:hypothetical protein